MKKVIEALNKEDLILVIDKLLGMISLDAWVDLPTKEQKVLEELEDEVCKTAVRSFEEVMEKVNKIKKLY